MTPFRPTPASTIRVTAVTVATPVKLAGLPQGSGTQVRVRNVGATDVFVEFGGASITASAPVAGGAAGSIGVPPGAVEVLSLQAGEQYVAVAVETGAPNVEVSTGQGV